jgi:hypothetical protein
MEFEFNENPLDDLTKVPDDFHGLYEQDQATKKFKLATGDPKVRSSVAAVLRLNNALKKERTESKAKDAKVVDLSPLSPFGKTIDEIKAGIEAKLVEAKGAASHTVEQQVAKIKEDLSKGHRLEVEGHQARNKALTGQLFTLLGSGAAVKALEDAGAINPTLALPFALEQIKAVEKDGKFEVQVVDSVGDPRYSTTTGGPMSVKELALEMKQKELYKPLFKSETKGGGGLQPGATNRVTKDGQPAEKSPSQKIADGLRAGLAGRTA